MEGPRDPNTVHYHIYPLGKRNLEELRYACLQVLREHINVIWNAESFTLSLSSESCVQPHLYGQLWFDNAVEDEWYVVWLLQKLTQELDVAAKVWDDDGDFVLIEAADVLPVWLNPENSANRLFLYQGRFVLIPQPSNPAEVVLFPQNEVTVPLALQCLPKIDPSISARINKSVNNKIKDFPSRNIHRIRCHLPLALVHALDTNPSLISTLISLYLHSDGREKQSVMKNKKLQWCDIHNTNVLLTRCQYAQLISQRITTASAWQHAPAGHVDHQSRQLGLKITIGAELALSIAEGETSSDAEYTKYLKRLESFGYFNGNIEGSKAHTSLLQQAELFFRSSQVQESGSSWLGNSRLLKNLVSESFDATVYCNREIQESESDSWMDVVPDDVQKWFLKGRKTDGMESQCNSQKTSTKVEPEEAKNSDALSDLNSQLRGFINNISSHEGAEVPSEKDDMDFSVDEFINHIKEFKDQLDEAARKAEQSSEEDTSSLESDSLCSESEEEMQEYMRDLEEQLGSTTLGETFAKNSEGELDVDFNLVSNILESFSAEGGLAGPASSVLASLGVHLPRDDEINGS